MTNRTLSGLFWMSLSTGANTGALLVVLIVLARLLTPADFGVAAVATMVIGFSAIFSEFGIGPAVVQRPELRPAHLGTGWTLSVALGIVLGGMVWLSAPAVAAFFELEPLTPMLRTLAWTFPIQGLAVVSQSLLQRELRFRCLAILEVVTAVLGYGTVGITLALCGFGAWALVGAYLAQISLNALLLLAVRPHRVWPLLDRRACGELLYFGSGFTVGRVSNYAAGQGENVVIGYCLGAVALGIYGRAYQLMAGPAVLFGNVLDRVLFPAMGHVQHDRGRLADAYRRGTALVALVILPVSALVVAVAPELIAVLLGPEWNAVALPLQILGVGMLFRTGCKISDSLVRATGAVYRRSWRQAAYAALVVAGAWVGQWWGVEGVAVAVLATLLANFLLMAHLSLVLTGMSWRAFARAHLPGLATATLVGIAAVAISTLLCALDLPPLLVLFAAATALLPALLAARFMPALFLGADGEWMVGKLKTFLLPPAPDQPGAVPAAVEHHPLWLLTRGLAGESVRYCRWKGRLDLARILNGRGDLDLLVHHTDMPVFLRVAAGVGFRPLIPCFETPVACETHLYGLDPASGVLLHIHAHTALMGARPSRVDDLVLRHCAPEKALPLLDGMPVVQPGAELIAVVLRAMDAYAHLGNVRRLAASRDKLQANIETLLQRNIVTGSPWPTLLARYLPGAAPAQFAECVAALRQPTSWLRRFRLARGLQASRRAWPGGRYGGVKPHRSPAPWYRLVLRLCAAWWRLRHGHGSPKQLPKGGAVIAIVGPDASGKSTLVTETAQWLGRVFRVQTAHLGKPPSAWLTLLPNALLRLLRVATPALRTSRQDQADAINRPARPRGLLYRLRAVILAWDRRALARRLARRTARGWLIVCDRYPSPVVGAPDSARLMDPADDGCTGRLACWLARLENRLYRQIPAPDIVVRLSAPLAVAVDRNEVRQKAGKESADWVTRRHKQFFLPDFPHASILQLDTNRPRGETVETLRRLVWVALDTPGCDRVSAVNRQPRRAPLAHTPMLVEFIGATGAGKSTLMAATAAALARQGVRVCTADDLILARHGLSLVGGVKLRSALVQLLTLLPFMRYLGTRDGRRVTRLALRSIGEGMGSVRIGFSLLRNFAKRVGGHLLLESIRRQRCACDVVLCDEGIVHAAHNLFVYSSAAPDRDAIARFGRLVPKPDRLIWVAAPAAQSESVIRQRGHTRVAQTPEAAGRFAEHALTTFETLARVEGIAERMDRVDNDAVDADRCEAVVATRAAALAALLIQRLQVAPPRSQAAAGEMSASRGLRFGVSRNGSRPARRAVRRRDLGLVRTP